MRVVILSSDEYNSQEEFQPVGVLVIRQTLQVGVLGVRLGPGDPLPGATVMANAPIRIVRSGLRTALGWLTDASMIAVEQAVRDLYELP